MKTVKLLPGEKFVSKDWINPDHYKVGGIEVISYLKAKLSPEELKGYLKGNVIKYLSRAASKSVDKADAKLELEDYTKAKWYLDKLIETLGQKLKHS